MGVKVRPYTKRGKSGWDVDIIIERPERGPGGEKLKPYRERFKAAATREADAYRQGERRLHELLANGLPPLEEVKKEDVPTLMAFGPRYIREYAKANKQKPSTIIQKERVLDYYLYPRFGLLRLDLISDAEVQRLKADLMDLNGKTTNNVLCVLNTLLKAAVRWKVITTLPCSIQLLRVEESDAEAYSPSDYKKLVAAADQVDRKVHLAVLLGGDAGLRCGEIIALEKSDLDFHRRRITISRSEWEGHLTTTKGRRRRRVKMTERLYAALLAAKESPGSRVLWREDGREKVTQVLLAKWMRRAQRKAGLRATGAIHILRHTFCSRLAIGGAPALAIKRMAGHRSLATTQRYMHLAPGVTSKAIRLLDMAADIAAEGDDVTGDREDEDEVDEES